jgi:tetratricopeptide (TPR) repeat protein
MAVGLTNLGKEYIVYQSNFSQPRRSPGCGRLIALIVIAVIGYSAVRYFIDQNNYNTGHQAYQQADCSAAISHFDSVINGRRIVNIGRYPALAQQEKSECLPYQAAIDKQQAGEINAALVAYADFVSAQGSSVLAEAARKQVASLFEQAQPSALASQETCDKLDTLLEKNLIPRRDENLPPFYLACGQVYDTANNRQDSFAMYESFLSEYPNYSPSYEAENGLVDNPVACEEAGSLQHNYVISNRPNFMLMLYNDCGLAYEADRDWEKAIAMYESFLAYYPNDDFASVIEQYLARSIVAQAKASGAGEIPAPERSGSTGSGFSEVVIQNDSPERLRIVFSGPESRVEELSACNSCTKYTNVGPADCPEKGPVGRYKLSPGQYDVVVESISYNGITPWSGNWHLTGGGEYSSCFFIVTTIGP